MSSVTYSLAEIRDGTGWPPGARFAMVEPVPGPAVYLTAADLAGHFGVSVSTFHSWRARYGPDRSPEAVAKAPVFPQPETDVQVGRKRPQAVWREGRLPELEAWRASLPGRGAH